MQTNRFSVFDIDMRVETRTAERKSRDCWLSTSRPEIREPPLEHMLVTSPRVTVGMLATMLFPPAIVVLPIVESVPLHESYDLIIGVDGLRVATFLALYERMREARAGEIVYLNVLRNGHRRPVADADTSAVPPPQSWVR